MVQIIRYSKPLSVRYSLSSLVVLCPWIIEWFYLFTVITDIKLINDGPYVTRNASDVRAMLVDEYIDLDEAVHIMQSGNTTP